MKCDRCGTTRYVTIQGVPCPTPGCDGVLGRAPSLPVEPFELSLPIESPLRGDIEQPEPQRVVVAEQQHHQIVMLKITGKVIRAVKIDQTRLDDVLDYVAQRAQHFDKYGFTSGGDILRKLVADLRDEFGP